jgi:CheY-like chemotaxis protein
MTILSPAIVPARPRALVVDDDRINLLIYEAILRKGGFDVSTVGTGREAHARGARNGTRAHLHAHGVE